MKFLPVASLAHHEAAPQRKPVNLSNRKLPLFSKATKEFRVHCGTNNPDIEALEFYALNHYTALVGARFTKNEALPTWAVGLCKAYTENLTRQGERLMHYMFSIITREARHSYTPSEALTKKVREIAGQEMVDFITTIRGNSEGAAVDAYMNNPPDVKCGPYVRAIEELFDHGKWSSSYGGKPWGQIARTLGDMLYGKTSLEMMVDTAYTLAHNNGPMFNKGMMYSMYSNSFKNILDVQRGGMIPELIRNKTKYQYIKSLTIPALEKITQIAIDNMGEDIGEDVDWQKVVDLGALQSYSHLIKDPKPAVKPEPAVKPAPAKPNVPQFKLFNGKPAKATGFFEVVSGEKVTTMERIA